MGVHGDLMNNAKRKAVVASLSGFERKVYDAMPAHAVRAGDLVGILSNRGQRTGASQVLGALNLMLSKKLVYEIRQGEFQKIQDKPERAIDAGSGEDDVLPSVDDTVTDAKPAPITAATPPAVDASNPLERFAVLSNKLRELAKLSLDVADQIDAAALDSVEYLEKVKADNFKVRQLKELLSSF
jgi:hypothetical protein